MIHSHRLDQGLALVCSIALVALGTIFYYGAKSAWDAGDSTPPPAGQTSGFTAFASANEYSDYLGRQAELRSSAFGSFGGALIPTLSERDTNETSGIGQSPAKDSIDQPSRVSETNVQVAGIDEPDIVKTDGENIFFSSEQYRLLYDDLKAEGRSQVSEGIVAPDDIDTVPSILPTPVPAAQTRVIKAQPVSSLAQRSAINATGNLLLADQTLVVTNYNEVAGYAITNPDQPAERWKLNLHDTLVTSRLWDNTLYLVTTQTASQNYPCPLEPAVQDTGSTITIACDRVYRPIAETITDTTYTIMALDPATGQVKQSVAFVGQSSNSVIYMSAEAIYVAIGYTPDSSELYIDFYLTEGLSLLPGSLQDQFQKINGYDLSATSKLAELQLLTNRYLTTLSSEQREQLSAQLSERQEQYLEQRKRTLTRTGLVKVDARSLQTVAQGEVPGYLLNQFSLDEHAGYLRVATTSGSSWFMGSGLSTNDVYVLDQELKQTGSLLDLGLDETIHSARFVGERGYLVTFKQTDPFFVLDLSNPRQPKLSGELQLPGFSSYLDPLTDTLVLGLGQENGKVKLSLFDVTNADQPRELAVTLLDEFWSEAQSNHHAFLHDAKYAAFFLPAAQGGYVFSYANAKLTELAKVGDAAMKRAVYMNDHMYLIGETSVTVLDEATWQQVAKLELQ